MTLKECINAIGGNFEDILARFRTEDRIEKYLRKFLPDHTFLDLQDALANNNIEEAFRAAHTLKGVAQNLGFKLLAESTHLLTEALRVGNLTEAESLFKQVGKDYSVTVDAIGRL